VEKGTVSRSLYKGNTNRGPGLWRWEGTQDSKDHVDDRTKEEDIKRPSEWSWVIEQKDHGRSAGNR